MKHGTVQWLDLDGTANARVVVPGVLLRSDNLQSLTAEDVERLVTEEGLELVLDLRTDVEVELEGPGPLTREPRVRIEHRSLYPQSGGNTDLEAATVKPWGEITDDAFGDEAPVVRTYMALSRSALANLASMRGSPDRASNRNAPTSRSIRRIRFPHFLKGGDIPTEGPLLHHVRSAPRHHRGVARV